MSHPHLLLSNKDEITAVREAIQSDAPLSVESGFLGDVSLTSILSDADLAHDLVPQVDRLVAAVKSMLLWPTPERESEMKAALALVQIVIGDAR